MAQSLATARSLLVEVHLELNDESMTGYDLDEEGCQMAIWGKGWQSESIDTRFLSCLDGYLQKGAESCCLEYGMNSQAVMNDLML